MSSSHSLYLTKHLLCKNCLEKIVNFSSGNVLDLTITFKNKYKLTFIFEVHKIFRAFRSHIKIISASRVTKSKFHNTYTIPYTHQNSIIRISKC